MPRGSRKTATGREAQRQACGQSCGGSYMECWTGRGHFLGDVGVAPLRRMPDTDAILTVTRHLKFLKVISREINI